MDPATSALPPARSNGRQCPDRIEVDRDERHVPAATVKAWIAHLRSHGWTDKELDLVWLTRARQGVTR